MDATTRSPILGYNHNIQYRGRVYHVQTEDSGPATHRIFTHLFFAGTILASKKIEYDPLSPEDIVKPIMQSQHKAVLRELKNTTYDDKIQLYFTARGEAAFLDDETPASQASHAVSTGVTPPPVTTAGDGAEPQPSETSSAPAPDTSPAATVTPAVTASPRQAETPAPMVVELKLPTRRSISQAHVTLEPDLADPNLRAEAIPPLPSTVAPDPRVLATRTVTPAPGQKGGRPGGGGRVTPQRVPLPGAARIQPQAGAPSSSTQQPGAGVVVVQRNIVVGVGQPQTSSAANRPRPKLNYPEAAAGQRPASSYRSGTQRRGPGAPADGTQPRRPVDVQFSFPGERAPDGAQDPNQEDDKGLDEVILEYLAEDDHDTKPPK